MLSSVIVGMDGEYIIIDNTVYYTPKKVLFGLKSCICVDKHDNVYVNGYQLVRGKWKITPMSLFHLFF